MIFLRLTNYLLKPLLVYFVLLFMFSPDVQAQLLVKDINDNTGNAAPEQLVETGGILYFVATHTAYGKELWKSDGTEAGTVMIKDINPGVVSSGVDQLTVMNGKLYFEANDGSNGSEIWTSDGTESGTTMLKDIYPGSPSASSSPDQFEVLGSTLFFSAYSSLNGKELWKTDGTPAGTVEVKDIRPNTSSSSPKYLTSYNGEIYFQANDGTNGREIWKSDGTSSGTVLLKNIRPSSSSSTPSNLQVAGDLLYFKANDGTNGTELWKTDGTEANTALIDINIGSGSSSPNEMYEFDDELFFAAAANGATYRLFKTDGTTTTPMGNASSPSNLYGWNGALYYNGSGELWMTNGTTATRLKDLNSSGYSYPGEFTAYANRLFFTATDGGSNGKEIWMTDGTEAGTQIAMDVKKGSADSAPSELIVVGNRLFFNASDLGSGSELRLLGNCDPNLAPIRKEAGTHYSLFETVDANGWTHYCDCANNILLSLEKGSTGTVIPEDSGVSIKIDVVEATYHVNGCNTGDCFLDPSTGTGAVVFNRTWDVLPTVQPTSGIPVRFYFSNEEYNAVNAEMINTVDHVGLTPLADASEMSFFKVTNAGLGSHPAVEDIKGGDAIVLTHDGRAPATPSETTWVKNNWGTDYFAEFLVSSFSGGGGGAASGGAALPVELVYFSAKPMTPENKVYTEWVTASEFNNYGFFIERSYGNTNNWQIIGFLEAKKQGSSKNEYNFIDKNPEMGDNYYRLRQVDIDGTEDFSNIAHVEMDLVIIGNIFPNPVSQNMEVQIDITTPKSSPAIVEVYNISRELLIQNHLELEKGPQLIPLDLIGLPSGMYIIKVESRGTVVNTKLMIQE